jgi:hypothetical protein
MGLGKTYSTRYLADSNNNTGASDQVLSSTPTGISWVNADTLSTGFWLADGNDIYNSNSGFVGIGTTDPKNDLDIVSADPTLLLRFDGAVNGTNSGRIKFSEGGDSHVGHMEIHYDGATNKMYFNSPIDGNTGLMTIERTGDVGINTTNPTSKLHIAKTTTWGEMSNPIINIQNNGTGGNVNTAHNMGSITWLSGTVSTAEIKAIRNTPASGDNVELRFSTSAAGVQGERMTINNNGIVFINNSLGVNVTSITTGYKLVVGGGDIRASQAVAKISLGQLGSQGDSFFGASGIGSPTVGSQDYGFYSAHNAYRTATGPWKHSRTDAIGAVRLLGSGGGSSGNSGFSFDYSANNGSSDITWTNRMHLFNTGILKLSAYGAGIMQTSSDGTVSSGGDIDIDESVIINDNLVNYRFTALENTSVQYWLLCFNAGYNDVNGTLWGDRSSGHHQAMNLDIVVSAKSASMQTGMLTTKQVLEANEQYTLVTLTYNTVSYVAIKYNGHPYPITGNGYFTGLLKSTIGTDFLLAVNGASVSAVAAFSNANTKATIQAAKVGINTADPAYNFEVNGTARITGDVGLGGATQTNRKLKVTGHSQVDGTIYVTGAATTYSVEVGQSRTTAGTAFLDLTGEVAPDDYGLRMIRYGGANALSKIVHTGTNNLEINAENGGDIVFTNGNVGIGTTNPTGKLDISRTSTTYAVNRADTLSRAGLIIKSSGNFDSKITFSSGANSVQYIQALNNAATTGRDININPYGGNVGIGTTGPSYKLDVTGTIRATGDVIAYSDARVKDNVVTIENALYKVNKLRGVSYTRNDVEDKTTKIGVIAQEVLEVLPEVVQQDDEGKYSVAYGNMVGLLIESIKELKAEVDELKSRL